MPLQGVGFGGRAEAEGFEEVGLFGGDAAGAGDRFSIEFDAVSLDLTERREGALR